ncbi:MAG: hypothetical protein AB7I36_16825 [Rhodospirillaceae bacterium]
MSETHVFTIAAANYLPKVRVLFQSLRRIHPDWRLHLALADEPNNPLAPHHVAADEVHSLNELAIPNWRPWAFGHTLIELATAMKPFMLRRLLRRPRCKSVIYLDPDIVVFSPLREIETTLEENNIALTPHLSVAETTIEGVIANELCTSQHGIYNLGFIGVAAGPQGRAFGDWWADRLYHFCREDIPSGIYTDQRWIDFVPAFFDRVAVLRSSRFNVAPWNLAARRLAGTPPSRMTVDGQPLGFYHFSQVDNGANDTVIADQNAAADLTAWYRAETAAAKTAIPYDPSWALGCFENGEPISREQRLVYRLRKDLQQSFPDPYAKGRHSYLTWWQSDARRDFPALFRADTRGAEIQWLLSSLIYGRGAHDIRTEFRPDNGRSPWVDEMETERPLGVASRLGALLRGA